MGADDLPLSLRIASGWYMNRFSRKSRKDVVEDGIVKALEQAGCEVWVIERPCDLLTLFRGRWMPLECKTGPKLRKDQPEQTALLTRTQIPVVRTPMDALRAIGAVT
jgi:hypothetical protein